MPSKRSLRRRRRFVGDPSFGRLLSLALSLVPGVASAATLQVGPGKTYSKPCAAIAAAKAGDVIEVDAAGNYDGDHCAWSTDALTVRGVGGRAKIDAGHDPANSANGKGIFVIAAPNVTIENFELAGAVVPDQNGAGIRHQGTNLTVRNCYFHDNENGILASPPTAGTGEVLIEGSEFAQNGFGDGYTHNIYVNHYAKFTLRFSYSHGAKIGHLVKSRALENHVLYNRLTNEAGGTASYEATFPSSGLTYVIGNILEQSTTTDNHSIVDYGSEPATNNPDKRLFLINNTIVNDAPSGTFVKINSSAAPAVIMNNLFVGPGTITTQAGAILTTNHTSQMGDPKLAGQATYDYRLLSGSPCIDAGTDPGLAGAQSLLPTSEYVHPLSGIPRNSVGKIDIGAYEFGNPGVVDGGGSSGGGSAGGGTSGPDHETAPGGDGPGRSGPDGAGESGCSTTRSPDGLFGMTLGALAVGIARRRRRPSRAQQGDT